MKTKKVVSIKKSLASTRNKPSKKVAELVKTATEPGIKKQASLFKKILKGIGWIFTGLLALILLVFVYVNLPVSAKDNQDAKLGVTFSARYASDIGLNWRDAYLAMLTDLNIKHVRLPVYWDMVEKEEGQYDFADLDWQLQQAQAHDAKIIMVIGRKVPRWPECFIPKWTGDDTNVQKEKLLKFEEVVIKRYKDNHSEIVSWQIENEPFLDFGVCPTVDNADLLDSEIAKVKSIDSSRPILVTDSGEISPWIQAASRGDIFGTTMYREVYSSRLIFGKPLGHWRYPIGPNFFKLKQTLIKLFANQDKAIVIELQGEPWVQGWTVHAPVEVQLASMNANILADNVAFAKKTGMKEIYIWGVEWWYWMKVQQNNATLWEEAKILFKN